MSLPPEDQIVRILELTPRRGIKSTGVRFWKGGVISLSKGDFFYSEDVKGGAITSIRFFEVIEVTREGLKANSLEGQLLVDGEPHTFDGGWVARDEWLPLADINDQIKSLEAQNRSVRLGVRCVTDEPVRILRIQVALFCMVKATLHDWAFDTIVRSLREGLRVRKELPCPVQPPVQEVLLTDEFDSDGEGLDRIVSASVMDSDGLRTYVPISYDEGDKRVTFLSAPPVGAGTLILEALVKPVVSVNTSFDMAGDNRMPLVSISSIEVASATRHSLASESAVPFHGGGGEGFIVNGYENETISVDMDLVLVSESSSVLMSLIQCLKDWVRDNRLLRSFNYGYHCTLEGVHSVSWDTAVSDIGELKVALTSLSLRYAPSVLDYRSRGYVAQTSPLDPYVVRKVEQLKLNVNNNL